MKAAVRFWVSCLALFGISSTSGAQELTAQRAVQPIRAQALAAPMSALAAEEANPQFLINARQAGLRDHHLVKAPPVTARLAPQADQPAAMGTATEVAPAAAGAASPISVTLNRPLSDSETNGITSTVSEPSVAVSSDGVALVTGNWFASISKDNGQTFSYRNPYSIFSAGGSQGFCCDQAVIYAPSRDIMFWYLQGVQDGNDNVGRLAFAVGDNIRNENWQYYDLTPMNIGGWQNEWFDFPDLALSGQYLYVSTNSFATQGTPSSDDDDFARAVAVRIDLDQVAQGAQITPEYFSSVEAFSLRPTQGATETMYLGSHDFSDFGRRILVFGWPDAGTTISRRSVRVDPWSNAPRVSVAKDGNQWLRRADFRMTAAWVAGNEAGFAWSAAGAPPFKNPHVRVAVVDGTATSDATVAQPHLWNDKYAFAYPAAYSVSSAGGASTGVAVEYGGGGEQGINPAHAVGVLKRGADGSYKWQLQATAIGSNGPADGRWGDYLTIRPAGGGGKGWVATGYTLDGGSLPGNVLPRLVYFEETSPEVMRNVGRDAMAELQRQLQSLQRQLDSLINQVESTTASLQQR
jgi:hypothetical protein